MLTLEERERLAYITGDTATANLLGQALDEIELVRGEASEPALEAAYTQGWNDGREAGYEEGREYEADQRAERRAAARDFF